MNLTKHGTWKRRQRLTIRPNDTLLEVMVLAAGEERRTVAETLLAIVTDWALKRDLARSGNPK
jgi:hypothetical protein